MLLQRKTTISKFLSVPDLSVRNCPKPKSSARVLTSLQNLRITEKKESEKVEKEALKKERLRIREEKRLLKAQGTYYIVYISDTYY